VRITKLADYLSVFQPFLRPPVLHSRAIERERVAVQAIDVGSVLA
jgi:secreted Zn-dependent insulinase-like peptidase